MAKNMGIIDDDDAEAAELASSVAIDEANLSIDLTIDPLLSDWEFFVFSLIEDSELLFAFFFADC
jgi:hypothetical protein